MSRQHFCVRVLVGLLVASCPFVHGQCDFEFSDRFHLVGASIGFVTQAVAEPDSLGGRITIAGGFTPNFPSNIIQWNGSAFSNFNPGYAETAAIYIGYVETGPTPGLYSIRSASGQVSLRRFIAGAWQTIATTSGSSTSRIFIIRENGNDEIYIGINGPNSQSSAPPRILKWNGSALVAVGPNLTPVSSTVLIKDFVLFDDGTGRKPVVGFNNSMPQMLVGGSWQTLGSSATTPSIEDLHVVTVGGVEELWAGGEFSVAGGTNLAKWDGSSWNSVGSPNDDVFQIADFPGAAGPELFVSGVFNQIGGQMISQSARLSNGTWLPVPGRKRGIFDQFIRHTVGGSLVLDLVQQTFSGMMQSQNILTVMRWSGTEFVPPEGDGLTGPVFAMLRHDDGAGEKLWIGGSFGNSASSAVRGIATYDGKTIAAPGETQLTPYSSTYTVNALAKFNGQICAGGFFHGITTPSGALVTNSIATWNGSTWSGFGTGVKKNIDPGTINALVVFDAGSGPELYVGGSFTTAGGVVAANLPRGTERHGARSAAERMGPSTLSPSTAINFSSADRSRRPAVKRLSVSRDRTERL